jgi:spore maturation protein CgeB
MQHDYGDPSRGESYEEANFRSALAGMGHDVLRFDFMSRKRAVGVRAMRRELREVAASADPDVCFFVLFGPELDAETIREVGRRSGAPTVNWFADDHWRFSGFTDRLGGAFDWCVTTDEDSLPRYAAAGIRNVILSQWACNRYVYHPMESNTRRGVTFVGRAHSDRPEVVAGLRAAGFEVECRGRGWPDGRVTTDEMVEIFSTSTINLNLANSSRHSILRTAAGRILGYGGSFGARPPQIKGRTFEIPGCGGFQLTEYVPHLERYFELEREISVYRSAGELAERVAYWLANPTERQAVADAGHRRVIAEHTYDQRFAAIFGEMGLV